MIKKTCARLVIGFFLCLASLPALARPALWVVKDANTTIYLFGTVHLLPNDAGWRYHSLDQALSDSHTLYIEATDDDPGNMTALVLQHGMDASHPLNTLLSSSEMLRLGNAANKASVPGGMPLLNVMRPWLAALTIATAPLLKAGLDPAHGVDKQLKAQMMAAGKPVIGFETAEQQIRLLADMPQSVQLALLRSTLRDFDNASTELTRLIDAWKAGDVATIARLEDEDLRQQDPQLYQRLLVERNHRWAATIGDLLAHEHGIIFVAVGAAHLAGPDSLQAQLHKLGFETEREGGQR
jgi:uncharacterized protein YbaP (TraB family)